MFDDERDVAAALDLPASDPRQVEQEVLFRNGTDSVETQAVEAVFPEPEYGVLDEEITHFRPAEVDGRAPRCVQIVAEELSGKDMNVGAVRTEMVVHDVEEHRDPEAMRGVNERLQLLGRAVGAVRRIGQHAVIAPVVAAGKVCDRHQLDRVDAEALQFR